MDNSQEFSGHSDLGGLLARDEESLEISLTQNKASSLYIALVKYTIPRLNQLLQELDPSTDEYQITRLIKEDCLWIAKEAGSIVLELKPENRPLIIKPNSIG